MVLQEEVGHMLLCVGGSMLNAWRRKERCTNYCSALATHVQRERERQRQILLKIVKSENFGAREYHRREEIT